MQLSPLRLEDYLLKELRFALNSTLAEPPSAEAQYDPLDIEINATTQMREDSPLAWRCELAVRSKDETAGTYPYTFHLVYVGFFNVVKEFPADRVAQMVRTNAPALLYSAAREAIIYLTGRGRLPAVLLPSITFLEPPPHAVKTTPSKRLSKSSKAARKK